MTEIRMRTEAVTWRFLKSFKLHLLLTEGQRKQLVYVQISTYYVISIKHVEYEILGSRKGKFTFTQAINDQTLSSLLPITHQFTL